MSGMPFDAKYSNGKYDRTAYSADIAKYFGFLAGDGIMLERDEVFGEQLKVESDGGSVINVKPGYILVGGRMGWIEDEQELTLEAGGTAPRYDTVVVECNTLVAERNFYLKIVKGAEATSPTPPVLTRNASVWQMGLANLYRDASSVTTSRIDDTRSMPDRCGISSVAVPSISEDSTIAWDGVLGTGSNMDSIMAYLANFVKDVGKSNEELVKKVEAIEERNNNLDTFQKTLTISVADSVLGSRGALSSAVGNLSLYFIFTATEFEIRFNLGAKSSLAANQQKAVNIGSSNVVKIRNLFGAKHVLFETDITAIGGMAVSDVSTGIGGIISYKQKAPQVFLNIAMLGEDVFVVETPNTSFATSMAINGGVIKGKYTVEK